MQRRRVFGLLGVATLVAATLTAIGPAAADAPITLSGRVTDAATGQPVAGIEVDVISVQDGFAGPGPQEAGFATTAADGTWSVPGLATPRSPGFWVCFNTAFLFGGPDYFPECWHDALGYSGIGASGYAFLAAGSTVIPAVPGQVITGIDAHLLRVPHETYSGRVTAADTGAPLAGVKVSLRTSGYDGQKYSNYPLTYATTAADGTYSFDASVLAGTNAYVCFSTFGTALSRYADQCWNGAGWTALDSMTTPPAPGAVPVPVGDGVVAGGLDAHLALLAPTGLLNGVVHARNGQPLHGVTVEVFDGTSTSATPLVTTHTAADGSYHATVPNNAVYRVCFTGLGITGGPADAFGYLPSCHGATSWTTSTPPQDFLTPIDVVDAMSGIDGVMQSAAEITGSVTQVGFNLRLRNVAVQVFDTAGAVVASGTTSTTGVYRIDRLYPGTYTVCFDGRAAKGGYTLHWYSSQCWSAVTWNPTSAPPAKAAAVSAVGGASAGGINARLAAS